MGCRSLRALLLRALVLCAATGLPPDRPLPNTPLPPCAARAVTQITLR